MKNLLITTAFCLAATAATAQNKGPCDNGLIEVIEWSVALPENPDSRYDIEYHAKMQTAFDKPVRMIQGHIEFKDVFDRHIQYMGFGPDQLIEKGATFVHDGTYAGTNLGRLLEMNREDVKLTVCVMGLVYEDGTVQKF